MNPRSRADTAAAEMIGALALIAIFIAAVAIVAMVSFSQPAPGKVPAIMMTINNESRLIEISHEGGDPLPFSDMEIWVDDTQAVAGTAPGMWSCTNCASGLFSIGNIIRIDYSGVSRYAATYPDKVMIVYKKAGQQHQILTTRYLGTLTPTPTPGTTPKTPTLTTIPSIPPPPHLPPVANFTNSSGSITLGSCPLAVTFQDRSEYGPVSWSWNFGDGNTSTLQNPSNTYYLPGSYTVSLTVTDAAGLSDVMTRTAYVNVTHRRPFVDFANVSLRSGTAPLSVTFADTSVNTPATAPDILLWDFGDGTTQFGLPKVNINHTYASPGTYTVSLAATNDGGTNTTPPRSSYVTVTSAVPSNPVITASAGTGGTISPAGAVVVTYGGSQTFTITPNPGYYISSIVVDGGSVGSPSGTSKSYVFSGVISNHTINATFATNPVITSSAGSRGSISPSGSVSVTYGGSQSFTITPNSGYYVSDILLDGNTTTTRSATTTTYTLTNVIGSHTVVAQFSANPVITASAGTGGSISPSGSVSVTYGGSQTFTVTTNTGYDIYRVSVNGISQGAISTYTFSNVRNSQNISAAFSTWGPPVISDFNPKSASWFNWFDTLITIDGSNFRDTPTVTLVRTSGTTISCDINTFSSTEITCYMNSFLKTGNYYIHVVNPDGQEAVSSTYFRIQ